MTPNVYNAGDRLEVDAKPCPVCRGDRTAYNMAFGYWRCQDCTGVWAYDKDDPDYEEVRAQTLSDRLTAHIEAGMTLHELMQEREGKS